MVSRLASRALTVDDSIAFQVLDAVRYAIGEKDASRRFVSDELRAFAAQWSLLVFDDLGLGAVSADPESGTSAPVDEIIASVTEIARRAGVNRTYVGRLCATGVLTARKNTRGAWCIERDSAEAWLDRRQS